MTDRKTVAYLTDSADLTNRIDITDDIILSNEQDDGDDVLTSDQIAIKSPRYLELLSKLTKDNVSSHSWPTNESAMIDVPVFRDYITYHFKSMTFRYVVFERASKQ